MRGSAIILTIITAIFISGCGPESYTFAKYSAERERALEAGNTWCHRFKAPMPTVDRYETTDGIKRVSVTNGSDASWRDYDVKTDTDTCEVMVGEKVCITLRGEITGRRANGPTFGGIECGEEDTRYAEDEKREEKRLSMIEKYETERDGKIPSDSSESAGDEAPSANKDPGFFPGGANDRLFPGQNWPPDTCPNGDCPKVKPPAPSKDPGFFPGNRTSDPSHFWEPTTTA